MQLIALIRPAAASPTIVRLTSGEKAKSSAHRISRGMRRLSCQLEGALADAVAEGLPPALTYAGFSFGGGQAQRLAQLRPGARAALLFESCYPITGEWAFGPWPPGVPVQVHGMDRDPFFAEDGGDLDAARELVATVDEAELFTYPGDQHLFADESLSSYDAEAAALLTERILGFLARI